ncbi:MAG: 7-carboxy-7-deazaguanine synthase QueE [Gemmatales bacterium]|nr:7-carboxy-7-deazaguanine synthase QueE [Gemmatales bacterium]MCS7161499.1 7-carboxy-7-deazaguanine synthase QueE [Gemmatales bacterium]MDW8176702.1 7-carboxy-7-deazaguanine synthase QueE [Gemmatales bacterium]MDW8221610.1 7-carboxy-7-deazaguanine synthase QueE [Gemmatales bacterium]
MIRVAEIFHSIQGEGILAGTPSVFVRVSGCNLRCRWCDTEYASWQPQGDNYSVEEILDEVLRYQCGYVVITGGEPFLYADLVELCRLLHESGRHITLETAGTIYREVVCDLLSLSPKLSNSTPWQREAGRWAQQHERLRIRLDVLGQFLTRYPDYQLKFVIEQPSDLIEVQTLLGQLPPVPQERILLMPQGVTSEQLRERGRWLVEACKRYGYRYCPRLHIELFGNRRGV